MKPEERLTLFNALKTNVFAKPEERLAAFKALESNDEKNNQHHKKFMKSIYKKIIS